MVVVSQAFLLAALVPLLLGGSKSNFFASSACVSMAPTPFCDATFAPDGGAIVADNTSAAFVLLRQFSGAAGGGTAIQQSADTLCASTATAHGQATCTPQCRKAIEQYYCLTGSWVAQPRYSPVLVSSLFSFHSIGFFPFCLLLPSVLRLTLLPSPRLSCRIPSSISAGGLYFFARNQPVLRERHRRPTARLHRRLCRLPAQMRVQRRAERGHRAGVRSLPAFCQHARLHRDRHTAGNGRRYRGKR
jgi:hypothetical protein